MYNIAQAEGLNSVFLRYNPDVFRVNGKPREITQENRLKLLRKELEKHIHAIPTELITVHRLFYNNMSGKQVIEFDTKEYVEQLIRNMIVNSE